MSKPSVTNYLGITPAETVLDGTGLWLRWLCENFDPDPPPYATEDVLSNFAWAYILALLDIVLLADKSGNQVWLFLLPLLHDFEEDKSFSWGSAIPACL